MSTQGKPTDTVPANNGPASNGPASNGNGSTDSHATETAKKRVLLIEDEPLTRLVLLNEFRMAGLDVDPAPSGRGALVRLRRGYPDAIFLGLPLRDIDGVQLIKEIRRDPQYKTRPIYVCDSAFPARNRSRKAMEAGATKVFDKLATPMHVILAEIVAHLAGKDSPATLPPPPIDQGTSTEIFIKLHEGVVALNKDLQSLAECKDNNARVVECGKIHGQAQTIAKYATVAGMRSVGRHAAVLEAFLKEVCEKPNEIADSSLHTISHAVDVLATMAHNADNHEEPPVSEFFAVVVDDDENSSKAICSALSNAGFTSTTFADPAAAMKHLASHRVDLVVLDVGLASQNSDLYTRIHQLPLNQETSVILVTKPAGPQRFQEVLSTCDTQFLVKPQSATNYLEIALKASSRALKNRAAHRTATPLILQPLPTVEAPNASIPSLSPSIAAAFEGIPAGELPNLVSTVPPAAPHVQTADAELRKSNEELQQQLESISAEAATHRDELHMMEEERKGLVERILASEIEINRIRGELGEEHEKRRQIEQELRDLGAIKAATPEQSEQQSRVESELQAQLSAATEAAEHAQVALKTEAERSRQLEQELKDLTATKAASQEQSEEQSRLEASLKAELNAAREAAEQAQAALKEESARSKKFEQELKDIAATKPAAQASGQQAGLEASFQEQLKAAKEAAEKAEAALKEESARAKKLDERLRIFRVSLKQEQIERSKRFDEEVVRLQQRHDELNSRMTVEQQGAAEAKQRCEELQSRLEQNTANLEQVNATLKEREADKARLESELQAQLSATKAAADQAEAALKQKAAQCSQLEEELTTLRREHKELQALLASEHQKSEESRKKADELERRLRENAAELERVRAELGKAGHSKGVEEELATLRRQHEEIHAALTAEQRTTAEAKKVQEELENRLRGKSAELERIQQDRNKSVEEKSRLESEVLARAETVKVVSNQMETAREEQTTRLGQLQEKLAQLQQTQQELSTKVAAGQQVTVNAGGRTNELEDQLRKATAELERVKADRNKMAEDQKRLEAELTAQIDAAAKETTEQAESTSEEEPAEATGFKARLRRLVKRQRPERNKHLDDELTGLRTTCEDLKAKLAAEQQAVAETRRGRQELEARLGTRNQEFERIKKELELQAANRARLESELNQQRTAAKTASEKSEAASRQEAARNEEVARIKRELEQQAALRTRLESELNEQRTAVAAAAQKSEAASREAKRSKELTDELTSLRQARQELSGKLETAQAAVAESRRWKEGLESQLTNLRESCEELNRKLAAEQQVATETRRTREELETRLSERNQEFERVKQELEQQATNRARLESELSEQRTTAKTATERSAGREAERAKELTEELTSLRKAREELNSKLEKAQAAVAESRQRGDGLQTQLVDLWMVCDELNRKLDAEHQIAADTRRTRQELDARFRSQTDEFERIKRELEQQAAERARLQSELGEQGSAVRAARQEESERRRQLESQLAGLQLACAELNGKLAAEQQLANEIQRGKQELESRLGERNEAFERIKRESEQQAAERARLESELGAQRTATKSAVEEAESACRKEAQRSARFEEELAGLWQVRDDLKSQLAQAQEAAEQSKGRVQGLETLQARTANELQSVKAELDQHAAERAGLESQHKAATESNAALNAELCFLRERQGAHEQELSAIQDRISESTAALARVTSDLETERGEHRRAEERATSLMAQLQDVRTELSRQLQVEKENQNKVAELERQVREREETLARATASLEAERTERGRVEERASILAVQLQELHTEITKHLQVEKENQNRVADLERQLREREEAFMRVTASLDAERIERRRIEDRASTLANQLQELHTEVTKQLRVEKENQTKISDLERKLREREEGFTRVTASFENERAERSKVEERASTLAAQLQDLHADLSKHLQAEKDSQSRAADLQRQLREREDAFASVCADLEKVSADRQLADQQLQAAGRMIAELRQYSASVEETKRAFARSQEELQFRWQTMSNALSEREAKLQRESSERQRLAEALETMQHNLQIQAQTSAIELAKLRSALDVESMDRRRLEGEAAQSRYALLNALRAGRALINGFRRQNQQLVGQLMQTTRQLLAFGLDGEQKRLAETVLETGLKLQATARQSGIPEFSSIGPEPDDQPELIELIPLHPSSAEEPRRISWG